MKSILVVLLFVLAYSCDSLPKHPTPKHPAKGERPTLVTPDGKKFKAGEKPPRPSRAPRPPAR